MRALGWPILIAVLCAGCGAGSSTTPSPPSSPSPAPVPSPIPSPAPVAQFRLDGTISDALSKNAISGSVDLLTTAGVLVAEAVADVAGQFTFGSIPTGAYVVRASASGYDTSSQQINLVFNLRVGIGLPRSGITALMIADPGSGTNLFCKPNGTVASNVSILNGSIYPVAFTFSGGAQGDPATAGVAYNFTLSPSAGQTFSVVPGSYDSSGQSFDGKAVLEKAGWVFSLACDFNLEICPQNNNRACRPFSAAAIALIHERMPRVKRITRTTLRTTLAAIGANNPQID